MKGRFKGWVKGVVAVVVFASVVAIMLPLVVDANSFRPRIEKDLSQALNRPVQVGNLSFSVFTASLVADNVIIGDDPQISATPFLQATTMHIGVSPWPLIFEKKAVITRLVANEPSIHLIHAGDGTWNFSSLSRRLDISPAAPNTAEPSSGLQVDLNIEKLDKVVIHNATVTVSAPASQPVIYRNVDISARQLSMVARFPFHITASLPAGGAVRVNGTAGPVSLTDVSETPFQADIVLNHFNPAAADILKPGQGLSLIADITAKVVSDGHTLHSVGTLQANHLQLMKSGEPAPQPVQMSFNLVSNLGNRSGEVRDLQIRTGQLISHAAGSYTVKADQILVNLKLSAQRLPIDDVRTLLPALGVKVPHGSTVGGGTVTANLAISGSASAPVFNGPIDIEDTTLTGFNLGSKLDGLAALSGVATGNSTAIQTLKLDVTAGSEGVRAENLYAFLPAVGTATGSGTIAAGGALDFNLLVKLNGKSTGGALGVLSSLGGLLGRTVSAATGDGIPLKITGTQQDPHFRLSLPQLGSVAQQGQPDPGNKDAALHPRQVLQALFGRSH